jgi:hypothetical protein
LPNAALNAASGVIDERRQKRVAISRFFFYNDQCLLLFDQVTKRERGEAKSPRWGACEEDDLAGIFPEYVQGILRVYGYLFR